MRAIPPLAVDFVSEHEALRLTAYDDLQPNKRVFRSPSEVKGRATIGYGHTNGVTDMDVVSRRTITRDEAKGFLREDLEEARSRLYQRVDAAVIESLTANQYAALLSFTFNLGAGDWTIWRRLNARQYDQVPAQMARFVNAGGKKLQGLVNRRNAEIALWSSEEPGSRDLAPPSSMTRAVETPPTEDKQAARGSTIANVGGGIAAVSAGAVSVKDTLEPASWYSENLQAIVAGLAIFVAVCGVIMLVLGWMKRREAKR